MFMKALNRLKVAYVFMLAIFLISCSDNGDDIEYASGNPSILAGNWVVFEFQGGNLDGRLSGPYDMSTALLPDNPRIIVLDNLYNSGTRIKAQLYGDSAFFEERTRQLEVINMGGFDIEQISINGYINDNNVLKDFIFQLARNSMENMAFSKSQMTEVIFLRTGFYDQYNSLIDSVMVMGYRKTGFEDEDYY
jgi:hypothetical protein